jgi:hypothetical protein
MICLQREKHHHALSLGWLPQLSRVPRNYMPIGKRRAIRQLFVAVSSRERYTRGGSSSHVSLVAMAVPIDLRMHKHGVARRVMTPRLLIRRIAAGRPRCLGVSGGLGEISRDVLNGLGCIDRDVVRCGIVRLSQHSLIILAGRLVDLAEDVQLCAVPEAVTVVVAGRGIRPGHVVPSVQSVEEMIWDCLWCSARRLTRPSTRTARQLR